MNPETLKALFALLDGINAGADELGYSEPTRESNEQAVRLGRLIGEFLRRYGSSPALASKVVDLMDKFM